VSEWREQYDRMKRWRETMATDRGNRERVTDIFFAFAQTCFHMADWLEDQGCPPITKWQDSTANPIPEWNRRKINNLCTTGRELV
jgi:hypothetical protein